MVTEVSKMRWRLRAEESYRGEWGPKDVKDFELFSEDEMGSWKSIIVRD